MLITIHELRYLMIFLLDPVLHDNSYLDDDGNMFNSMRDANYSHYEGEDMDGLQNHDGEDANGNGGQAYYNETEYGAQEDGQFYDDDNDYHGRGEYDNEQGSGGGGCSQWVEPAE